ncbi:MAG: hypothetical protein N3I35_07720 [Clostridia bacterium]|nr:hypothetical protein [Clostridia bacterium]
MEEKPNEKVEERSEGKNSRIKIGSFIIIVFILLYVPSLIHWLYGETISTDIVRIGELEDSVNTDGYFVRNEEVLQSPFEGTCIPEVGEGEKVAVNTNIATVLKDDSDSILEALKNKELDIIKAKQEKNKNTEIFSEDIVKIENEIGDKVKLVIEQGNKNSLLKIGQIKDDIDELIQKKATISGDTGSTDTYINSLQKEKEKLQLQMRMNTRNIVSKSSGIISYTTDGYENMLRSSAIKDITPKFLESIKEGKNINFTGSKTVEAGKPFAKVIKDLDCYILAALTPSKAERYKVGDSIDIRINEISKIIDSTIEYKSEKIDGKIILAFRVNQGISETSGLRKVNVDIISKHYKGYRVPLNSLLNIDMKNMKAKVVLVKSNYATIRDVKIKGTDEEFAIVTSLDDKTKNGIGLYDIYVCNPGNIQEGQMIIK